MKRSNRPTRAWRAEHQTDMDEDGLSSGVDEPYLMLRANAELGWAAGSRDTACCVFGAQVVVEE